MNMELVNGACAEIAWALIFSNCGKGGSIWITTLLLQA